MQIQKKLAHDLITSWENQQNCHVRFREERFAVMFDVAMEAFDSSLESLDIACGPGSLSRRFLKRFPDSRITSIDYDPVLLRIGKQALSVYSKRIRWVEGDLKGNQWTDNLVPESYNTAMSTTALHWLNEKGLENLYNNIYGLLQEGGIFMNGDHMVNEDNSGEIFAMIHGMNEKWSSSEFSNTQSMDWDEWWENVRRHDEFTELLEERSKRYPEPNDHNQMVPLNKHIELLKKAGFRFVDVIWQYSNDRILLAIK